MDKSNICVPGAAPAYTQINLIQLICVSDGAALILLSVMLMIDLLRQQLLLVVAVKNSTSDKSSFRCPQCNTVLISPFRRRYGRTM